MNTLPVFGDFFKAKRQALELKSGNDDWYTNTSLKVLLCMFHRSRFRKNPSSTCPSRK